MLEESLRINKDKSNQTTRGVGLFRRENGSMINSNRFCMSRVADKKENCDGRCQNWRRKKGTLKAKKYMDKKKEQEEEVVRMNVDSNDDLCLPAAPPSLNGQGPY